MNLSDRGQTKLRNLLFRGTSWNPSTIYIGLSLDDPTQDGTGINEPSGDGYARYSYDPGAARWTALSTIDGHSDNSQAVTFTADGGSWGELAYVFLAEEISGHETMFAYKALPVTRTINDEDSITFPVGSVDTTFGGDLSDYGQTRLRNMLFRGQNWNPSTMYIGFSLTDPLQSCLGITEPSVGDYARHLYSPGATNWSAASATDGFSDNNVAVTFTADGDDWGELLYMFLAEQATGNGTVFAYKELPIPRTILDEDSVTFPISSISGTFA